MSYSICKIKNLTGSIQILRGHEFQVDEIYTIQDTMRQDWANDETILTAISAQDFEIHSSVGAIANINDQINFLKDNMPIEAIVEYTYAYSLMADAVEDTCDANTTKDIDFKIENQQGESYEYKYLWGGEAFGQNIEYGDYAEFYIIDKDGWLVTTGQLDQQTFDAIKPVTIKKFVIKRYLMPNDVIKIRSESPGKVPVGLYLRARYHAVNSGSTRKLYINYELNNKD